MFCSFMLPLKDKLQFDVSSYESLSNHTFFLKSEELILKNCFFGATCIVMFVADSKIKTHNNVLHVVKELKQRELCTLTC